MTDKTTSAIDLVSQLTKPTQWCCIFEHEGQMRHGTTDAPFKAADTITRLKAALECLGAGCDANDGGLHSCMGTGSNTFCPDCGLMLRRVAYVLPHVKPGEAREVLKSLGEEEGNGR